jgi:hypothetical protein
MLCSSVQEVIERVANGEVLLEAPVPVNPIATVEFDGIEYGGVVRVWDAEDGTGRLPVAVGPVVDVRLEADESVVKIPLFPDVDDATLPVPVGPAEEVELELGLGYGALGAPTDEPMIPETLDDGEEPVVNGPTVELLGEVKIPDPVGRTTEV